MNNYIVGITNLFEGSIKLYKIEAENEIEAIKKAVITSAESEDTKNDYTEWMNSLSDYEEIMEATINSELLVSKPMLI